MGVKHYKPTTPARRAMTTLDFSEKTKKTLRKYNTEIEGFSGV